MYVILLEPQFRRPSYYAIHPSSSASPHSQSSGFAFVYSTCWINTYVCWFTTSSVSSKRFLFPSSGIYFIYFVYANDDRSCSISPKMFTNNSITIKSCGSIILSPTLYVFRIFSPFLQYTSSTSQYNLYWAWYVC